MPSSTVFSYWRRDHRRLSPSLGVNSPRPLSTVSIAVCPPKLPDLPPILTLTDSIVEAASSSDPNSPSFFHDPSRVTDQLEGTLQDAASPRPSLTDPNPQSPPSKNRLRPRSSPGESKKETLNIALPNHSQLSVPLLPHPEQSNVNPPRPSSPWRLAFGKGTPAHQPLEERRGAPMNGAMVGSNWRIKTSADKVDHDQVSSRRDNHHEHPFEHMHQKSGKMMLHLLNPISLLARRRSPNHLSPRQEDVNIRAQSLVPAIPDDYDPRIRGNIVHDFSAPRRSVPAVFPGQGKGNIVYSNRTLEDQTEKQGIDLGEHTPVFREHFEEDQQTLQVGNKGYLQSSLMASSPLIDQENLEMPAFARKLPLSPPDPDGGLVGRPIEIADSSPLPQSQPLLRKSSQHRPADPGLPSRLKSNASSKFSFDMGGVGSSAQEKLLEEKHKEKEAARKEKAQIMRTGSLEFEADDIDYDEMMMDDDDLEERIPGVNADPEGDDLRDDSGPPRAVSVRLVVPVLPTIGASLVSPRRSNPATLPGSQDASDPFIGSDAVTDPTSAGSGYSLSDHGESFYRAERQLVGTGSTLDPSSVDMHSSTGNVFDVNSGDNDDDDIYFDDGHFEELPADAVSSSFDESIFDDESCQLYEPQFYSGTKIPMGARADVQDGLQRSDKPSLESNIRHVPSLASEFLNEKSDISGSLAQRFPPLEAPQPQSGVLSQQNLEALHSALTRVADASANEPFWRSMSVSEKSMGQESVAPTAESHLGPISNDSRLSQTVETMGSEDVLDEPYSVDYDDDGFDDHPIIAEANAEALENDDGSYGLEFGFYAHPHGNCQSEPFCGGFFGPRGVEGVYRSHSGRVYFREPSLTPITERSEWSPRNSITSLTAHGAVAPNPSTTSPGLAQLVDMSSIGDEMSLSTLMKLRRDAWGGSDGSLSSGASSPPSLPPPPATIPTHRSCFPTIHETCVMPADSLSPLAVDGETLPTSPTVPLRSIAGRGGFTTIVSASDGEVLPRTNTRAASISHSRASSSASISYVMETAEDGSSQWVLERRRTGGSGEVEVYEREVVADGRI